MPCLNVPGSDGSAIEGTPSGLMETGTVHAPPASVKTPESATQLEMGRPRVVVTTGTTFRSRRR